MPKENERLAEELYKYTTPELNIEKILSLTSSANRAKNEYLVELYRKRVLKAMWSVYSEADMIAAVEFYSSENGRSYHEKAQAFGEEVRDIITDLLKVLQ